MRWHLRRDENKIKYQFVNLPDELAGFSVLRQWVGDEFYLAMCLFMLKDKRQKLSESDTSQADVKCLEMFSPWSEHEMSCKL